MNKNKSKIRLFKYVLAIMAVLVALAPSLMADDDGIIGYDENGKPIFKVTPNEERKMVNTCASYQFQAKDTLFYAVESKDSIVIGWGVPLRKNRDEILMVVCDSVTNNNRFHLHLRYMQYSGYEYTSKFDLVERNKHDWQFRKINLTIDSLGKRYYESLEDTATIGQNSGGAFQPHLFFNFGQACADTGQAWNVMHENELLVENGVPAAAVNQSLILNSQGYIDLFGYKANKVLVTKTGQGSITIPDPKQKIRFTTILSSGGQLCIGTELRVPIYYEIEQEQKIHIHTGSKVKEDGNTHHTITKYTLMKTNRKAFKKNNKRTLEPFKKKFQVR